MAITHYIDTSLPELTRTRVKSLTNRITEQFPVLIFGDNRSHNFVFHNAGTVESFSGNASYSLRVTLGNVKLPPANGTYVLTCGSSATLNVLSDASTIQSALNGLTGISSAGGVTVQGEFPDFLITWNTAGAVTALSGDGTLLIPLSNVNLTTTQTGTASVVNQVSLQLRQSAIVSQSSWTTITSPAAGWTGTISTNTAGALSLLQTLGKQIGGLLEVDTVITAQVLDSNAVPVSYFQAPITLRATNLDAASTVSPPLTTYSLGDILYGNSSGSISRLAGNTAATLKFLTQTGTGTVSAAPIWTAFTPGSAVWGSITGTLSNQTDLQTALNGKQATLTIGNLTEATSTVLTISGGTGAIIGSGLTIQVKQASGTVGGYLSSTDWTTFNNKQPAGAYLTSVTADAPLSGAGTSASHLVISQAGTLTSGYLSSIDWNTFNAKQPAGTYVTAISIASANGFAGSSSGGATPALTLTTSITGILKGNATAISAATSGTDYSAGTSALSTGILKSTTITGALSIASAATDYVAPSAYASANGLTMATARLLGRTTVGSGAAEEISIGSGLSMSAGILTATGTGGTVTSFSSGNLSPLFTTSVATATTTPALSFSLSTQAQKTFLAGPTSGVDAAPTFRTIAVADVPTLDQNTTGSAASLSISGQTGLLTFTGLTLTNRVKTVRDAADTILELGGSYTPTATWNWTSATVTWPTFNQNTTGSAAKWTTARNLAGNSVDGSADVVFANKFIAQGTADSGLSAAQFLGALGTGLIKNTTTTGVLSIAASATDYVAPSAYASTNGLTMATARLLGRTTAGGGAAEEISVGTGLSLSAGSLSCTVTAPVGANPTATIGLAAVNGVAATFMRSDGAPALNQALLLVRSFCHC